MRLKLSALVAILMFAVPSWGKDLASGAWLVTFDTRALGPVDVVMQFRLEGGTWQARSRGESQVAIDLVEGGDGKFEGPVVSGKPGPKATLTLSGGAIEGSIDKGLLGGSLRGVPFEGALPLRDYAAVLATLDSVVKRQLYRPAELDSAGWKTFRAEAAGVAKSAKDDFDFLMGVRSAWKNDPFSHFALKRTGVPVTSMIETFDGMRVGGEAARLRFDGDVAILTVDTMMGQDTIEQIEAAYAKLATSGAKALVIDLRENDGGAFAVVPLVQHVLREPLEAGTFVGNRWWTGHGAMPARAERDAVAPWTGWSIVSFWRDAQEKGLLRIRFEPQAPHFDGRIFVLTSGATASAAELAADALRSSGRATLVGETTQGEMLSGSYFDLRDGFMVFLPVADYVSLRIGRIDGKGVGPDVEVPAAKALERALELARN
jgi:hypothetical protein